MTKALPFRAVACALVAAASLVCGAARAQTLGGAEYDAVGDALVVRILYRGTHPDHRFRLAWDACMRVEGRGAPQQVAARAIDEHGDDAALHAFEVTRRFDLSDLPCRPARVTIRLGPVSNVTVFVPPQGERERGAKRR